MSYNHLNTISWCFRWIKTMVTSTVAAEYITASNVSMHIKGRRQLLSELTNPITTPTSLAIDSKSAIAGAKAQAPTKTSKYVDVRRHHIQHLVANKTIAHYHMSMKELQADTLTKPFNSVKFCKHRTSLQFLPPSQSIPMVVGLS